MEAEKERNKIDTIHYHAMVDGEISLIKSWKFEPGHKLYECMLGGDKINELNMELLPTIDYVGDEGYSFLGANDCIYVTAGSLFTATRKFVEMFPTNVKLVKLKNENP